MCPAAPSDKFTICGVKREVVIWKWISSLNPGCSNRFTTLKDDILKKNLDNPKNIYLDLVNDE